MRRYELLGVLALAAGLRVLLLCLWTPDFSPDALEYDRLARSLVDGRGYTNAAGVPTSFHPPLYPAFVAAGYFVSQGSSRWIRFVQTVLDLGTVTLTYRVGGLFGRSSGLIAAVLVAVNVGTISATSRLLSESVFTFLLMAGVAVSVAWLKAIKGTRTQAAIALGAGVGAVLGAAVLTRGVLLLYPLCLVVFAGVSARWLSPVQGSLVRGRGRAVVLGCLAVIVSFALTLAPWTLRNYWVHGAFIPVSTQLGRTLYDSYMPLDGWKFGLGAESEITAAAKELPELDASALLTRAAVNAIRGSAVDTLRLEGLKILYFWAPIDWEILPQYGAFNPTYAFIGLWAFAYVASRSRREPFLATGAVWLPILYLFGMSLVFFGSPRYRLPAEPLLATLAATGLVAFGRKAGRRRMATVIACIVAFLVILAVFAGPLKYVVKTWITNSR
jgi:4-amino-4-deoxy-L-arabinose transferase-like glycosyltransferase